jgi:hypothetical protein
MRRFWKFLKSHYRSYDLLLDYLGSVKYAGWDVMWAPVLPSIVYWLLWFLPNPPAWWITLIYGLWLVVVAGYFLWRPNHVRFIPNIKITRALQQETPVMDKGIAVDYRTVIQLELKCMSDAPVYECVGYLQRVRFLSDDGWKPTALNESLRLGWSNQSDAEIVQHPGSEHNLNVAFIRHSDHWVFPWVIGEVPPRAASVFGEWPRRCGSTFRFDIQVTSSNRIAGKFESIKAVNVCLEVYFDNEPNKPKLKLVELT